VEKNAHNNINIICLESDAFYALIQEVLNKVTLPEQITQEDNWIDIDATMKLLKFRSKTTLQKLRDSGKIRFSKLGTKHILYYKPSIIAYIESNSKDTF